MKQNVHMSKVTKNVNVDSRENERALNDLFTSDRSDMRDLYKETASMRLPIRRIEMKLLITLALVAVGVGYGLYSGHLPMPTQLFNQASDEWVAMAFEYDYKQLKENEKAMREAPAVLKVLCEHDKLSISECSAKAGHYANQLNKIMASKML